MTVRAAYQQNVSLCSYLITETRHAKRRIGTRQKLKCSDNDTQNAARCKDTGIRSKIYPNEMWRLTGKGE